MLQIDSKLLGLAPALEFVEQRATSLFGEVRVQALGFGEQHRRLLLVRQVISGRNLLGLDLLPRFQVERAASALFSLAVLLKRVEMYEFCVRATNPLLKLALSVLFDPLRAQKDEEERFLEKAHEARTLR